MRLLIGVALVLLFGCGGAGQGRIIIDEDAGRIGEWQGTWQNVDAYGRVAERGPGVVTIDRPANALRYQGEITDTATGKRWTFTLYGYDTISSATGQTIRVEGVNTAFRRKNPLDLKEPEKLEIRFPWNAQLDQIGLTRGTISADLLKK